MKKTNSAGLLVKFMGACILIVGMAWLVRGEFGWLEGGDPVTKVEVRNRGHFEEGGDHPPFYYVGSTNWVPLHAEFVDCDDCILGDGTFVEDISDSDNAVFTWGGAGGWHGGNEGASVSWAPPDDLGSYDVELDTWNGDEDPMDEDGNNTRYMEYVDTHTVSLDVVVDLDSDVSSDKEGEWPGQLVGVNNNDSDDDGKCDLDDDDGVVDSSVTPAGDPDLVELVVDYDSSIKESGAWIKLKWDNKVKIWKDRAKNDELVRDDDIKGEKWELDTDAPQSTYWIEGRYPGEVKIKLKYDYDGDGNKEVAKDIVMVTVVKVDVTYPGVPEFSSDPADPDDEENPGAFLALDAHKDDVSLTITPLPNTGTVDFSLTTSTTTPEFKLWKSNSKNAEVPTGSWDLADTDERQELMDEVLGGRYIEGTAIGDAKMKLSYSGLEDVVKVNVIKIDLDVDSNNDGSITDADDPIEEESPGNLICLNDNDDDGQTGIDKEWESPLSAADPDLDPVANLTLDPALTAGTLELSVPSGVRVWKDDFKTDIVEGTDVTDRVPDTGYPITKLKWDLSGSISFLGSLHLEGTSTGTEELVLTYRDPSETIIDSDAVLCTILSADITKPNEDEVFLKGEELKFESSVEPTGLSGVTYAWSITEGTCDPSTGTSAQGRSVLSCYYFVSKKIHLIGGSSQNTCHSSVVR